MGLRGTQLMGSIIYTLDSTRIADSGRISNLQIFDLVKLSTSYSSLCSNMNNFHYIYFIWGFDEQA
jgi:hypothetical protein